MSEDARTKGRRVLYVVNPGSDSEESEDDKYRRYQGYQPPPLPATNHAYHSPVPPTQSYAPTPLTTNLPPDHSSRYQHSNPTLSSPSSTSSPARESTPPPSTPGPTAPPVDLLCSDKQSNHEPSIDQYGSPEPPQLSAPRKFLQTLKSPFNNRSSTQRPSMNTTMRRPATSPTVSTPDSYSSQSNHGHSITVAEKVIIVVTADSERYLTVDISGANGPAFIRERIFSKLCIYDEEDQSQYSIYLTEIGAFALGEALSDERLFDLCLQRGDSRGTLKFFISTSNADVHEKMTPIYNHASPVMSAIPPPVLPYLTGEYPPLRPKRRSRSRQGSLSSASEQPVDLATGYEADLEKETHRTTIRPPPPQQATPPLNIPSNSPPSPLNTRRPSGPGPRAVSPLPHAPRSSSPPPLHERSRTQASESTTSLVDKYGHPVQNSPIPPPLSPKRPTFMHDDSTLAPPLSKRLHIRSGSDAAAEREQALQASEDQIQNANRQLRANLAGNSKPDQPIQRQRARRQPTEDDPLKRSDSWVVVEHTVPQQETDRSSPSVGRPRQTHLSPVRYKATSPYTNRAVLTIPNPPRKPPPAVPTESRPPPSGRPAGTPVPANWTVTWKGEEKGDQKLIPTSQAQWTRLIKGSKSVDNLKGGHPVTLQPGRRNPQLPVSRPLGSTARELGNYGTPSSALPKSYEPRVLPRQLPVQGPSHSSSFDFSQTTQHRGPLHSAGLMTSSSGHEPYPRPQSALGDNLNSPQQRHPRHVQSPTYSGTTEYSPDLVRSPRAASPSRVYAGFGPRPGTTQSDRSSEGHGRIDSRTPPRSPASPRSPGLYSHDRQSGLGESPSETSTQRSTGDSHPTLTQDGQRWISQHVGENSNEATILPPSKRKDADVPSTPSDPGNLYPPTPNPAVSDESDSDRDDTGTSIWKKPPMAELSRPKSILRGPALKVQIESTSGVFPVSVPSSESQSSRSGVTQLSTPAHRAPSPPSATRPSSPKDAKDAVRGSTFIDMRDYTWAPRPTPEDVLERLEEFFPEHDLDKPVIEASSGGTSPTTAESSAAVPAPQTPVPEKARVRGKKSIRIVAEEHKKRIDRSSRADPSAITAMSRKRSTKLWGSRLEEVTTLQAKASVNASTPESPPGGPTTFKWVRGELIGRGTYGRVYLALNATTGEMMAVKQVEIPQTASDKNDSRHVTVVQALKLESETLKDLDHPNIVQYLGFEETPTNLSIFLEYVPGGSIGSCLLKHGKFDEEVTKSFTGQILSGLEYLHSKGILHRDLKADNILVEKSGICKISDFGISKRTDDKNGAFTMQGTVFWMAPEVVNSKKKGYNFKVDIWSVGCVVLEMWAGMRPWNGDEVVAVMFKLYQSELPPPVPDDVVLSPLANDFRKKCFAINPDERPTAAELRKHPYLVLPPGWVFTGFT